MSRRAEPLVPPAPLPPEKAEEIRAVLDAILASPVFRSSRRCQGLLRRIVEETQLGHIDSLKERSLGIQVFSRPPDYDTSQDPVVRATAAEVRKKLAQYYIENGPESETRIDLPPGSYIAEFQFANGRKRMAPRRGLGEMLRSLAGRRLALVAGVILVTSLSVLAFTITPLGSKASDLDQLWEPVVKTPGSVLV